MKGKRGEWVPRRQRKGRHGPPRHGQRHSSARRRPPWLLLGSVLCHRRVTVIYLKIPLRQVLHAAQASGGDLYRGRPVGGEVSSRLRRASWLAARLCQVCIPRSRHQLPPRSVCAAVGACWGPPAGCSAAGGARCGAVPALRHKTLPAGPLCRHPLPPLRHPLVVPPREGTDEGAVDDAQARTHAVGHRNKQVTDGDAIHQPQAACGVRRWLHT